MKKRNLTCIIVLGLAAVLLIGGMLLFAGKGNVRMTYRTSGIGSDVMKGTTEKELSVGDTFGAFEIKLLTPWFVVFGCREPDQFEIGKFNGDGGTVKLDSDTLFIL